MPYIGTIPCDEETAQEQIRRQHETVERNQWGYKVERWELDQPNNYQWISK